MSNNKLSELTTKEEELRGSKVGVYLHNNGKQKEHKEYTLIGHNEGLLFKVGKQKENVSISAILKTDTGKKYDKIPLEIVLNAIESGEEISIQRFQLKSNK